MDVLFVGGTKSPISPVNVNNDNDFVSCLYKILCKARHSTIKVALSLEWIYKTPCHASLSNTYQYHTKH